MDLPLKQKCGKINICACYTHSVQSFADMSETALLNIGIHSENGPSIEAIYGKWEVLLDDKEK